MKIRAMIPEDLPALVELWNSFPGNALTGADGSEGFTAFLAMSGDLCFVLEEDGRVTAKNSPMFVYPYIATACEGLDCPLTVCIHVHIFRHGTGTDTNTPTERETP